MPVRGRLLRRQDGYSQKCMAKVILKDLKKVYPNTFNIFNHSPTTGKTVCTVRFKIRKV